ncbi:septation protein SepH [Nocardiopsis rhodophaea]|uniref:septation protein SepH n=1 Tax=Nocardiopsis rhodophaea TaxID=280238 RepID=UPI0031E37D07
MQELRLVAVSEDGTYLVLASAGRGTRFMLPVDDRLRAAVRGQFSRLGQYEIEVENPLRPKEIQARIRSGETAEAIADHAGIPIERVRWFEGPVLQEREYMAQQAQRASVRRPGESAPGPALGDLVAERVGAHQLETGDAVWDSWKREDNTWQIKLAFLLAGEERVAHWVYEPRRRCVAPADEEALRFLDPDPDEPIDLGPASANVTPFVPRRQEAAPEPVAEPADGPLPSALPERPTASGRIPVTADHVRPAPATEESTAVHVDHETPHEAPEPPTRPDRSEISRPTRARPTIDPLEAPAVQRPAAAERPEPRRRKEPPLPAAAAGAATAGSQPPRRKSRGRRASVPSWDEIMFGSKKTD